MDNAAILDRDVEEQAHANDWDKLCDECDRLNAQNGKLDKRIRQLEAENERLDLRLRVQLEINGRWAGRIAKLRETNIRLQRQFDEEAAFQDWTTGQGKDW